MNVKRLERLKEILLDAELKKPGKFNLNDWMASYTYSSGLSPEERDEAINSIITPDEDDFLEISDIKLDENIFSGNMPVEPNYCHTTGCALGWAASDTEFRKEGLILIKTALGPAHPLDMNTGNRDYAAGASFFGLSMIESKYLFDMGYYEKLDHKNPNAVVERIDQLLNGKQITHRSLDIMYEECRTDD